MNILEITTDILELDWGPLILYLTMSNSNCLSFGFDKISISYCMCDGASFKCANEHCCHTVGCIKEMHQPIRNGIALTIAE